MSDAVPAIPRRKRSITRYLLLALVLIVGLFAWQLLGPNPAILISRPTTYITSPLRPDGLPDYKRYINDQYAAGVTPESNAAVLLWQAIEVGGLNRAEASSVQQALGIATPPTDSSRLSYYDKQLTEDLADWYVEKLDLDESQFRPWSEDIADRIVDAAKKTPWRSQDAPPLSFWLDEHRRHIDLILEASNRAKLYMPDPHWIDSTDDALVNTWPRAHEFANPAAKALSLSAMRHLGAGSSENAWTNILALFRLAQLHYASPDHVDSQRGFMLEETALDATLAFLTSSMVSSRQIENALGDLAALPPIPSLAPHIHEYERIQALDAALYFATGRSEQVIESLELGKQVRVIDHISVDWNVVLRQLNDLFDRYAAAVEEPDYASRRQSLADFHRQLTTLGEPYCKLGGLARVTLSRHQRNQMLATMLFSLTWGYAPIEQIAQAETRRNLARIVGGLALYHHRHDEFPRRLDELAPDFLAELPVDPLTSNSYYYRRSKLGYLLYSAGPNTFDDGGSNNSYNILAGREIEWTKDEAMQKLLEKIPHNSDDLSIRLPVPKFQLPPPPK